MSTPSPVCATALPDPFLFSVSRRDTRDRVVVSVAGDIDEVSEARLRAILARCLADGVSVVDVDLAAVTYCGSCGLHVFLDVSAAATAVGCVLRLRRPSRPVARLLAITGTNALLFGLPAFRDHAPGRPAPAAALFGLRAPRAA